MVSENAGSLTGPALASEVEVMRRFGAERVPIRRCIVPVDGFFEWRAIKGDPGQAALCHCREGRLALRPSRTVENWRRKPGTRTEEEVGVSR